MISLTVSEDLAERLQRIAQQENRPVEEILETLLDLYLRQSDALAQMDGMFEDEATNLSTSVRETMRNFYQQQNDRAD